MDIKPTPAEPASAELAFEALRAEVADLRQGLKKFAIAINAKTKPAPNYEPALAELARQLAQLDRRMDALEFRWPNPERLYTSLLTAWEKGALDTALRQLGEYAFDMRERTAAVLDHTTQCRRMAYRTAGGLGFGLALGIALCFGVVAAMPQQAGVWIAATIVGDGPWKAGQVLMGRADPAAFQRMARLYTVCGDQLLDLCVAAIAVGTTAPEIRPAVTMDTSAPATARREGKQQR